MNLKNQVKEIAHVGIPTNSLKMTVDFYTGLGFDVILRTHNDEANEDVAFLQLGNYCIETFENKQAAMADGAFQHLALEVGDIETLFAQLKEENYTLLHESIQFLPFWEKGVKFFMIQGPNMERIEFCQKL